MRTEKQEARRQLALHESRIADALREAEEKGIDPRVHLLSFTCIFCGRDVWDGSRECGISDCWGKP